MKTLTIGALLADGPEDHGGATLYVFRDGNGAPLYVGKSEYDAIERARAHMGRGSWAWAQGPDALGSFILSALPAAEEWTVDFLTPKECGDAIRSFYADFLPDFGAALIQTPEAETALIQTLRPRFNVHMAPA